MEIRSFTRPGDPSWGEEPQMRSSKEEIIKESGMRTVETGALVFSIFYDFFVERATRVFWKGRGQERRNWHSGVVHARATRAGDEELVGGVFV
jgi:hypothetical protein